MPDKGREVWITGIGLVSCLGEGIDTHWEKLNERTANADTASFAPFIVHPSAPIEFEKQIPKKSDLRQMEQGQRLGTYAAGLALQSADMTGNAEVLARTDMIVAASGGERDLAVDSGILTDLPKAEQPGAFLNQRLMNDLRPTLFLGQLSNLFAGNISILHGVTGSSRTFLGEEAAGMDAVRIAVARIASGQSDVTLVGGACHGARQDWLLPIVAAGQALKGPFAPVFERTEQGSGLALGSLGAFLVLEAAHHAQAHGARAFAKLSHVYSDCAGRVSGARTAALEHMWARLEPLLRPGCFAVISGATGAEPATAEERAFLAAHASVPVRATGTHLGHGVEAQFPMNVALGALALTHRRLYPATSRFEVDRPTDGEITQIVVTGVGRVHGEGMALVEALT
jgi:3-oxoacyl-[acyl-carrier-protein] synthase II